MMAVLTEPIQSVLMSEELWSLCDQSMYKRVDGTHVLHSLQNQQEIYAKEPITKSLRVVSALKAFMPITVTRKVKVMEILWERSYGNIAQFEPWMAEHRSASIVFLNLVSQGS